MKKIKLLISVLLITMIALVSCKKDPIASTNTAPTASFTVNPTTGTPATTFAFDASGSTDVEYAATTLQVRWDWNNDGTYDTDFSTTKTANHQYADVGTYTVKLEVKDGGELTHTTTKQVIVSTANTVPTASFTVNPTSGTTATTFAFDASGSTDNEDATATLEVRWDWNNDGTYDTNWSTTQTETHQYADVGTYTIKLEVKDTGGLTNTSTKQVIVQQQSNGITFPDVNLEALIRETLDKSTGDITSTDLENITELDGTSRNISDISGIEYCTNLLYLSFWDNQITNINVLSGLLKLVYLDLDVNQISDISALSGLLNLKYLYLDYNQIIDISASSGLLNLEELTFWNNQITNINALSGLLDLVYLDLDVNQISDIGALIQNSGIDNGDEVYLSNNPLSEISINTYIPQLEARGVIVYYGNGKIRTKKSIPMKAKIE